MKQIGNSRVALVCIRLAFDLLKRDFRKYAPIAVAVFFGRWGLERWRVRLIRVSYFYFRYLDDVVDGDRACTDGPAHFLDQQSSQWRNGSDAAGSNDEADILFRFMRTEFARRNFPWHRVRVLALRIIEGLRFDLKRRSQRQLVSQADLNQYYAGVVLAPASFAHLVLDARAAPEALQEISRLIGWLQSLRDLPVDLATGLINIPLEDWERMPSWQDVATWRDREITSCVAQLRSLWKQWSSHADERSRAIMRPTVRTLLNWATTTDHERRAELIGQDVLVRC